MKLTTIDLYYLDQCSLRWSLDPPKPEVPDPTRELIKKILLMKSIGREVQWGFPGIASTWDQLFWQGKEITQENMKESVQGILAARKIYKKLPNTNLEAYSTKNLSTYLDSGITLSSSGDFLLSYPDRYDLWIYMCATPKNIRRSILPTTEHYLVTQNIRKSHQKPFYIVIYSSSTKKRGITYFRIRDNRTLEECRKIVYNLADKAKRKIYYPSIGEYCKKCKVKC